MRQQHHYADLNYQSEIETPPDTYTPNKVGEVSMENLQSKENKKYKIINVNNNLKKIL